MYCKHCGGPLELTDAKCRNCGAVINFLDGGQSFFEDNDLQEWGNRAMPFTPIPKTESREENNGRSKQHAPENLPRPHKAKDAEKNGIGKVMDKISWLTKKITSTGTEKKKPRNKHGKKKKTRIVNPNRLITVCIAFALVLVLIAVAIWKIVEISSGNKNTGDLPSQSTTEQTEQTEQKETADTDGEPADTDNSEKSSDESDDSEKTSDGENAFEGEADNKSVTEDKPDGKSEETPEVSDNEEKSSDSTNASEENANRVTDAIMSIFGQKQ